MLYLTDIFIKHSITARAVKVLPWSVQAERTKHHSWVVSKQQILLLTAVEAGRPRSGSSMVRWGLSSGSQTSRCVLTWGRGEGALWGLPLRRIPSPPPTQLPKAHLLMPSPLGIWISAMNFGKTQTSSPQQVLWVAFCLLDLSYLDCTLRGWGQLHVIHEAWRLVWLLVMFS